MPQPVFYDLTTPNVWVKVLDNVTSGNIWTVKKSVVYYLTFRTAGAAAPLATEDLGIQLKDQASPRASVGTDYYVMSIDAAGCVASSGV
jgi:hypothetical protein